MPRAYFRAFHPVVGGFLGGMRSNFAAYFLLASAIATGPAAAAECPVGALGTSRTIVVDPTEHVKLGGHQYRETLPLRDREVVLTFDDGPLPPYTTRILDALASECIKATFFMVGRMARGYPAIARRVGYSDHAPFTKAFNHRYGMSPRAYAAGGQRFRRNFEGGLLAKASYS